MLGAQGAPPFKKTGPSWTPACPFGGTGAQYNVIIYAKRGAGPICGHSHGGPQSTASPTESTRVRSGSTSWSLLWRITNYSESNRVQLSPTCVHSYAETQSTSVLNRSRHVCAYVLPSISLDVALHMQVPRVLIKVKYGTRMK